MTDAGGQAPTTEDPALQLEGRQQAGGLSPSNIKAPVYLCAPCKLCAVTDEEQPLYDDFHVCDVQFGGKDGKAISFKKHILPAILVPWGFLTFVSGWISPSERWVEWVAHLGSFWMFYHGGVEVSDISIKRG